MKNYRIVTCQAALAALACVAMTTTALVPATAYAAKPAKEKDKKASKEDVRKEQLTRHLRLALVLLTAGAHADALTEAQEALKLDKKNAEARRLIAAVYIRTNEPAKAAEVCGELVKDDPSDLWAASTRADLYEKTGDRQKALEAWEALGARKDGSVMARFRAAMILDELRLKGNAEATKRQEAHLKAYVASGLAKGTPEGKRAEQILMEISHGEVGKVFWKARENYYLAFKVGGPQSRSAMVQAEQGFKKVIQLKADYEPAHTFLGLCYASVKSPNHSLEDAEKELRKAPGDGEAWFALGRILREREELTDAAQAFEKSIKLQPSHYEAGYQLGVVYKVLGRKVDAVRVFEAVVMANPRTSAATKALGELQAIAPKSIVVGRFGGRLASPPDTDLFSTERYKASVSVIEDRLLGGVHEGGETVWLEKMLRRLVESNDLTTRVPFRVKVGNTQMINAFAMPHGNIYFTKGFLKHIAKRWPNTKLDENNGYIAGVMAHEITHVVKGHIVNRDLFRKAMEQGGKAMDSTLFTLTTRLNEIEADREGFIYMTAAGYNPSAMVEWMEVAGVDLGEPPPMEDHPTFDERVRFLVDFWTNDMRFAYQSFESGTAALEEAQKIERTDGAAARAKYELASTEYDRFVRFFRHSKEVWNNLGIAQTKLGVMAAGDTSALARWYTPMSIEKTLALKLPKLSRAKKRGSGAEQTFFARAKESLAKALQKDRKYARALVNLAAVHIAMGEMPQAEKVLAEAQAAGAEAVVSLTLRGVIAAEAGKLDEAIAAFEQATKASGDTAGPIYCLALAKQKKGDKAGAKTAYKRFLEKEDKSSAWAALAEAAVKEMDATPGPAKPNGG